MRHIVGFFLYERLFCFPSSCLISKLLDWRSSGFVLSLIVASVVSMKLI